MKTQRKFEGSLCVILNCLSCIVCSLVLPFINIIFVKFHVVITLST